MMELYKEVFLFPCGCRVEGVTASHSSAGYGSLDWMPCPEHVREWEENWWGIRWPDDVLDIIGLPFERIKCEPLT